MSPTPILLALLAQAAATPAATPTDAPAQPATAPAFPTVPKTEPAAPPNIVTLPDPGWMPLFNGQNLDGWYTFRQREGKNNDVDHVFKVENGTIHALDMDDTTVAQPNGYLATNEEFRNYRLRLEYKWGEKKLPVPRHPEIMPRDAGLLYHMTGPDQLWPMSVECQIQERDTGDIWLLPNNPPNPSANSTVVPNADGSPAEYVLNGRPQSGVYTYMKGGVPVVDHGKRLVHSAQYDNFDGWNTVEIIVTENNAVHIVNGHINNAVTNLQLPNNGGPMTQGKILLQQENNEVYYRNVQIKPLFAGLYGGPPYKVLIFSKTTGYRHASIPNGIIAIKKLGEENQFTADATEDAAAFTDDNLKQYKAVIFLSTTGDVLNEDQRAALERYIRNGGGFAGVHSASDTEYHWPWYGRLVGAYFKRHPTGTPTGTVRLEDTTHPSTSSLPLTWSHADEWYEFQANPRADVHVLMNVDESTYTGGQMGTDHPIAWYHEFEGGRSWYTALGHTKECYTDPLFLMHLLGGIMYAAGTAGLPPKDAVVLFDGKDTSHWVGKDNATFPWLFHDGVIEPAPATYPNGVRVMVGDIHTKETYTDYQLHAEFLVPAIKSPETRNAETNEQALGNSGIYQQGRYETQILDSFDHPLADKNDIGAIYETKDALVNAALPAQVWQAYDITYHAPRWENGQKTANARITAYLNGVLVQNETEAPAATRSSMLPEGPAPGPVMLQDHLNPVQFRNIWLVPLPEKP